MTLLEQSEIIEIARIALNNRGIRDFILDKVDLTDDYADELLDVIKEYQNKNPKAP
jgi:hypothetical protein